MPGHDEVLEEAQATLDGVDAALARLTEGSYGICTQCGAAISDDRLADLPTATACASHDA